MTASDPFASLGVTFDADGGTIGVWSASATLIEAVLFDDTDPRWVIARVPLTRGEGDVWTAHSRHLTPGRRYSLRAEGPTGARHRFDADALLLDPYGRGLQRVAQGEWRSVAVDDGFDWGGVSKPAVPLDRTVVYEAHVKGLTKLNPALPENLRGSYAGLAHPATIEHLTSLGVTSVQLLPVHAFVSEQRLLKQGMTNYWGYNTLSFFSPHAPYASRTAQAGGAQAVLREFKGMVRLLHEAGIEVLLDVVYNHTAEEGPDGPRLSLRGLDDSSYYRQDDEGRYIDVTGCGNTLDTTSPGAYRLVLDSLRYWANDVQIDGFRFDLAAALGRDARHEFDPRHPLLTAIATDPSLAGVKMIAEPWDVGLGGWQTGNFGDGWHEWNDRYRDRVRNFWLSDVDYARRASAPPVGIGGFATRLAGSSNTFSAQRGPLASVNFVTAHDGFTLADLVSYDVKHNVGNGENNRDGSDNNRSFNHGAEGDTDDPRIVATRRKAMRNLLGTVLLSAGIPMITAGDEIARSQRGNNNAYCHDSELTWLTHRPDEHGSALRRHVETLTRVRAENPALRPGRFARHDERVPSASELHWYDAHGRTMSDEDWTSAQNRTLQYVATSTPETEAFNRVLLIVHGVENPVRLTLPRHPGVDRYRSLWSSADDEVTDAGGAVYAPGDEVEVGATSMWLFRAEADPAS